MGSGAWSKIFELNHCNGEHSSLLCIQWQAIRQAKTRKVMMMSAYVIKEVQGMNADRAATITVNGSLAAAKRCATKAQAFHGTVLKIESTSGVLIAYKQGGKWFSAENEWAE